MVVLILAIIAVACVIMAVGKTNSHKDIHRLKERYRQLTFSSSKVADEALRLQIVRLRNMAPGHTEKWYLERLLHELESSRIRRLQ